MNPNRHLQDIQVGPIAYAGMRTIAKIGSAQTTGAKFVSDVLEFGPFDGVWQWIPSYQPSHSIAALFRQRFSLAKLPAKALIRIVSDQRYRLYVNGRLASRGPADVGRDYDSGAPGPWLYDVRDITSFLQAGQNVLALEVFSVGLTQNESTTGHPGFHAELRVSDDGSGWRKVGEPWVGREAPHLSWETDKLPLAEQPVRFVQVDLTKEPMGWRSVAFDDSSWSATEPAGDHWAQPLLNEIPPSGEAIYPATDIAVASPDVVVQGRTVQVRGHGAFAVRFDRVLSAFVQMRIQGVEGAVVTIMPNERKEAGFHRAARVVLRDGYQAIELPFFDSFSTIHVYVEQAHRPVVFESIAANFVSYPVQYRGSFECSDPALDRIWSTGRWLTQLCMQTHHLDSPHHQEPICDPGDYLIEALINYQTFGEPGLARQDLIKFGRILRQRHYENFHLSYALLWLHMLEDYRLYTGDTELERSLAPTVFGLLDHWRTFIGPNGLVSRSPNYMFMDWVEIAGFNLHHPPAVIGQGYITALLYDAFGRERRLANRLGETERMQKADDDRKLLRVAFDRELWVAERGLYRDGKPHQSSVPPNNWLPADTEIETFSPHVNTLAVSCGIATGERANGIMRKVLSWQPLNCQPYFMHFIFDALEASGLYDELAADQMRRWKIQPDTQSFYEMWDHGDLSHAWNSTPTYQLSRRVLGLRPMTPGWRSFEIAPFQCGLKWARGTVPSPYGDIKARWEVTASGHFELNFSVPARTSATVVVPEGFTGTTGEYGPGLHHLRFVPENVPVVRLR